MLGKEQRDAWAEAKLGRDFDGDIARPHDPGIAAGLTAAPHQQGDPSIGLSSHEHGQVGFDRLAGILRHAAGQISRAAVGRAGVGGNRVRAVHCRSVDGQRAGAVDPGPGQRRHC